MTSPNGSLSTDGAGRPATAPDPDAVALLDDVPLTPDEAEYVEAARAANTLRGYRSDLREFTTWCTLHGIKPMPAAPATVTGYLSDLARAGAKVGTMSRRISAIKFAHQMRNLSDPTRNARVVAVWEGYPPHPRRPARPGGPVDAPGSVRRPGRLPDHQSLAHPPAARTSRTSLVRGIARCSWSGSWPRYAAAAWPP